MNFCNGFEHRQSMIYEMFNIKFKFLWLYFIIRSRLFEVHYREIDKILGWWWFVLFVN